MLGRIDQASADIAELDRKIDEAIAPFAPAVDRLDEITGVGRTAAQVIIAEIGTDMRRFPTPGHLVSWAKFAPGVKESAGKKQGKATTGHGNPYLARVLGEAAVAAGKTHLPGGALPAHRPPPRRQAGHRGGRPLHPHHRLAPAGRPHRPLPGPRSRLLRHPHRRRAPQA
jgi:transposase